MWIMLIEKLSTHPSPPKLSVFWSTEWISEDYAAQQFDRNFGNDGVIELFGLSVRGSKRKPVFIDPNGVALDDISIKQMKVLWVKSNLPSIIPDRIHKGVSDHNWATARAIVYKGEKIRVFSNEFSVLTHARMALYLQGDGQEEASHELVPETYAEEDRLKNMLIDGSDKAVYDAALTDGCNHEQAQLMALGVDVSDKPVNNGDLASYPVFGWYRCKPEFARIFCSDREMQE